MRTLTGFLIVLSLVPHPSSILHADGGAVRLSEQKGNYRITVFTAPTPPRVGAVDVSVLVQEAASQEPASGVQVSITAERTGSSGIVSRQSATTQGATNKLYRAATFDLPEPGEYTFEVSIDGTLGVEQVRFELEAADPLPTWLAMSPWVGWPIVAMTLFGIHQLLVRWRRI